MKYIIETTENGVNETLEVDGNLYKKEWCRCGEWERIMFQVEQGNVEKELDYILHN